MTKFLKVSDRLSLPLAIANQATVLVGIRGSGKTNTAGVIAEELLDHKQPIVVLDPTDAWFGLRSSRDGKSDGYPVYVFGGPHGDLDLLETAGKELAEFVASTRVSVILSLRHLRKAAQRRFVTDFCEELYHLKGKPEYRSPLTVFIDEAPLFVPQKVMGENARTVGAVEDLIARGRNVGFGVVLISQRMATVNKDVVTQCDTIFCHRLPSPQDRKAIAEWFEENASVDQLKTILASLATLKTGEAWVWSPRLDIMDRTLVRVRRTFDSSASPESGTAPKPPKVITPVDLEVLKAKLAATVERAKQDDPKELKRQLALKDQRITELEKAAGRPQLKVSEQRTVLTNADREVISRVADRIDAILIALSNALNVDTIRGAFTSVLAEFDQQVKDQQAELLSVMQGKRFQVVADKVRAIIHEQALNRKPAEPISPMDSGRQLEAAAVHEPLRTEASKSDEPEDGELSEGQRRALKFAATLYARGITATLDSLSAWMDIDASGGRFRGNINRLIERGFLKDECTITDVGLAHTQPIEAGLTAVEPLLSDGQLRILAAVNGHQPLSLEDLGRLLGVDISGGRFRGNVNRLIRMGLITRNPIRLTEAAHR